MVAILSTIFMIAFVAFVLMLPIVQGDTAIVAVYAACLLFLGVIHVLSDTTHKK